MLSLTITEIKPFMARLFSDGPFDSFYMIEATVRMGITYAFDGRLNVDFYDSDVSRALTRPYCYWKEARGQIFHVIKGKRPPLGMKIVLQFSPAMETFFLEQTGGRFTAADVQGIYLNLYYDPAALRLTTGVSYRTFSLDKTLDHVVEDYVRKNFV